jgi:hypothetical protein
MKVDVLAIPRDEGFGMTLVVSTVNAADGTPLEGLSASNFQVTVIQGPSGWAVGEVLKIDSGVYVPSSGVYAFDVAEAKSKLKPGSYTFAIAVKGTKGRTTLYGQTLAAATMK